MHSLENLTQSLSIFLPRNWCIFILQILCINNNNNPVCDGCREAISIQLKEINRYHDKDF